MERESEKRRDLLLSHSSNHSKYQVPSTKHQVQVSRTKYRLPCTKYQIQRVIRVWWREDQRREEPCFCLTQVTTASTKYQVPSTNYHVPNTKYNGWSEFNGETIREETHFCRCTHVPRTKYQSGQKYQVLIWPKVPSTNLAKSTKYQSGQKYQVLIWTKVPSTNLAKTTKYFSGQKYHVPIWPKLPSTYLDKSTKY